MSKFYCASCNKEIKSLMHRCWFVDQMTCKVYDPYKSSSAEN